MIRQILVRAAAALTLMSTTYLPAAASDDPSPAESQRVMVEAYQHMAAVRAEHKQLEYFQGDWDTSTTFWIAPGAPPQVSQGRSHSELILGGRYLETRFTGSFMNRPIEGRGTIGFDNLANRYFATWIDTNTTSLWTGTGAYHADSRTLAFAGTMNDPMHADHKIPVREMMQIRDATHYTFTWLQQFPDGKEIKTMEVNYIRRSD